MALNVIIHVCDLKRSRSSVNTKNVSISTLPYIFISEQAKFYRDLTASFAGMVELLILLTER